MDLGRPIAYQVLSHGTAVYSADGGEVGKVVKVLAAEDEDVFDGIVIGEHPFGSGHRFADADEVDSIFEQGVVLTLEPRAMRAAADAVGQSGRDARRPGRVKGRPAP